jgi:hypothetical protein
MKRAKMLNRVLKIFLTIICIGITVTAQSRDDRNRYSVHDAMNIAAAKEKLNKGYLYKFGAASHKSITKNHGEFVSNKKTNAVGKTDEFACQWAFLSALLSFQDRITKEGGNAVVNLRSYYKKHEFISETEFECGNGAIIAGVTLVGDVVTLED